MTPQGKLLRALKAGPLASRQAGELLARTTHSGRKPAGPESLVVRVSVKVAASLDLAIRLAARRAGMSEAEWMREAFERAIGEPRKSPDQAVKLSHKPA